MRRAAPDRRSSTTFGPFTNTLPMRSRRSFIHDANAVCAGRIHEAIVVRPAISPRWMWLLMTAKQKHVQSAPVSDSPSSCRYARRSTADWTNHSLATNLEMTW